MRETNEMNRIIMLVTILERGKADKFTRVLDRHGIGAHLEFAGAGTATSEMRDLLSGSRDKDVILSFGTKNAVEHLVHSIDSGLEEVTRGGGLMIQLSPLAVNNLFSAVLIHDAESIAPYEKEEKMKNEYEHSLILIAVKQGFTEQVMQEARKAGASGGTVIRSRMVGTEMFEEDFGIVLDAEKEVLLILSPKSKRDAILEGVNASYGMRSPAQAVICSLPVDRAFKI